MIPASYPVLKGLSSGTFTLEYWQVCASCKGPSDGLRGGKQDSTEDLDAYAQGGGEHWPKRKGSRPCIHSHRLRGSSPVTGGECHVVREEAGPPQSENSAWALAKQLRPRDLSYSPSPNMGPGSAMTQHSHPSGVTGRKEELNANQSGWEISTEQVSLRELGSTSWWDPHGALASAVPV